jgi:hypothetical protein
VLCGQATVFLLALGSVLLAATRDGASARIEMDDVRGFFLEPSIVHVWFYLLVPVLGLYALNTFFGTLDSVVQKWQNGIRSPRAYAAPVIHASFLIGLLAHLVGGLGSSEQGRVVVGPSWQELGNGRQGRLEALDVEPLPDGSVKQIWASLEVRDRGGAISESVVSYNGPLSSGLGSELFLLSQTGAVPGAATLARGRERCQVELERSCELGDIEAHLLYLHPPGQQGALARVRIRADDNVEELWLMQGQPKPLADGSSLSLEGIEARPAIVLRRRHAPGNPWALVASVVLTVGLGMMWRRFL